MTNLWSALDGSMREGTARDVPRGTIEDTCSVGRALDDSGGSPRQNTEAPIILPS